MGVHVTERKKQDDLRYRGQEEKHKYWILYRNASTAGYCIQFS